MKRKVVWLAVSCLMVASLLLASCAPAATEKKEVAPPKEEEKVAPPPKEKEAVVPKQEAEMVKWTGTKHDGTVVEKMIEKPRYGGTLTQVLFTQPSGIDTVLGGSIVQDLANDNLEIGNWYKGPAGTGDTLWLYYPANYPWIYEGALATNWEMPDANTMVWHIRKGVHFQNKPPTNGRELTADDVAFSIIRQWQSPLSYQYRSYPWVTNIESITAPDKWTLVTKSQPGKLGEIYEMITLLIPIVPRDAIEKYGDQNSMEKSIGTGPFLLVDMVAGSSFTYERNPNYWRQDDFFTENTLPYVDTLKQLIIPDVSTRLAALRTGKIDAITSMAVTGLGGTTWEDARSLMKTNPELKWAKHVNSAQNIIALKLFDPELPWGGYNEKALKVRRALSLAINGQEMIDTFYGGDAEMLIWPIAPIPELAGMYIPFKELSPSIRELYEYHPDKARQLLAEAGYPNGFKTEIATRQYRVDEFSIVKEYWAKVGVQLEIKVVDPGIWTTMYNRRTYKEMFDDVNNIATPHRFAEILPPKTLNPGGMDDPRINEAGDKVFANYFDIPKREQIMKELFPYMLEQDYNILLPTPNIYHFWQPWLKSYNGEATAGVGDDYGWARHVWVDQELKKAMGH